MKPDERLLAAVRASDLAAANAALAAGADPKAAIPFEECVDRDRFTGTESLLHVAARVGAAGIVAALVAAGADPDARDTVRGRTPLLDASRLGHAAVVQALLAARAELVADPRRPEQDVLAAAIERGDAAIADALARAGAQVTPRALELACYGGRRDLVDLCLRRGVALGSAPVLVVAARGGHVELLQWLVAQGADLAADGSEALCEAANAGRAGAVAFLLSVGVSPAYHNAYRWTPLHFAAYQGDLASCEALLAAGADPLAVDGAGRTPRSWAEEAGRPEFVALLMRAERRP
ncbi:MAG: ankyrin repeat domain-containing protein [Planctomycetes bacterium]|nr:ankyrin repeat domain-containing protein [Planctomycetota bacterium]